MGTPREPAEVIRKILGVVPPDEPELRAQLEKIKQDSWYFPPEGQQRTWAAIASVLQLRFPGPDLPPGWPTDVSKIVRGIE